MSGHFTNTQFIDVTTSRSILQWLNVFGLFSGHGIVAGLIAKVLVGADKSSGSPPYGLIPNRLSDVVSAAVIAETGVVVARAKLFGTLATSRVLAAARLPTGSLTALDGMVVTSAVASEFVLSRLSMRSYSDFCCKSA